MIECCEICTGRHLTACCVIARDRVAECFTGTVDDFDPSAFVPPQHETDMPELFALKREQVAAEREAWEVERTERRRVAASQRNLRYRTRLRLVS